MKKLLLAIILVAFISLALARHNFRHVFDARGKMNLIEQLKEERNLLGKLEENIQDLKYIAEQRSLIRQLHKQGNMEEIRKNMREVVLSLERLLDEYLYDSFSLKVLELYIVYKDLPEFKDYILYYRAKDAILKNNVRVALPLLEDLVNNYPQSEKLDPGLMLLEEAYFKLGMDEELIAVYDRYSQMNSLQQNFWIAQSLYNLGRYEESKEIFQILQRSSRYNFKAQAMLALISSLQDSIERGIEKFLLLEEAYSPKDPYYDFIILSLARLYYAQDDLEKSAAYYSQYYGMHENNVEDAVLYEIAVVLNEAGDYQSAIDYLDAIIQKPIKSEYFVSAKFLKAVSQQGQGDVSKAQETIDEMIQQNNQILQTLNSKYQLLDQYHENKLKLVEAQLPQSEKEWLQNQVQKIETDLENINTDLERLYSGLNPQMLDMLRILEQEYFWYSSTISDMQALIQLAKTVPNKKIPKLLDIEIARVDSSKMSIEVIENLSHLPSITNADYYFAQILVEEKYYHQDLINTWDKIIEIAKMNEHKEIIPFAQKSKQILEENINSLNAISSNIYSGEVDENIRMMINEEIAAIENNKRALQEMKELAKNKFNKIIANRLSTEKEFLAAEFEALGSLYKQTLNEIENDIASENVEYQYNLLGVMFRQTQIMDDEYKEYQEKVKNE